MNRLPRHQITDQQRSTFERDGVVCLRQIFDPDWVEYLRARVEEDIAAPSGMVKNINARGATGEFFGDTFVFHHNGGFERAVFDSPAPALVADLLGTARLNLVFDQILVKEPGTSTPTTWHQDATYWPLAGDQIATLWVALDDATAETGAMEFVRGSHRWGKRFLAVSFDPGQRYEEDLPEVPDIEAERDLHDIISYELAPGDCTVHHGLTLHAAPGNASARARRRAYLQRFAGADVTYDPRPNLQRMLRDPGLSPGDALDCELFPVVWPREAIATS